MRITGKWLRKPLRKEEGQKRRSSCVWSTEDFLACCIFKALGQCESNVDQGKSFGRTSQTSLSLSKFAQESRRGRWLSSFLDCITSSLPPRCRVCLRQTGFWGHLLQGFHLDIPLLEEHKTKKLYGTKSKCVQAQLGQTWTEDTQRPKKPYCHF